MEASPEGVVAERAYDRVHPDEQGQAFLAKRFPPVLPQAPGVAAPAPQRAPLGRAGSGASREIARTEGATLVEDFLEGVVPARTYDGLHPDEQGQAMLAERLVPVLRETLARP